MKLFLPLGLALLLAGSADAQILRPTTGHGGAVARHERGFEMRNSGSAHHAHSPGYERVRFGSHGRSPLFNRAPSYHVNFGYSPYRYGIHHGHRPGYSVGYYSYYPDYWYGYPDYGYTSHYPGSYRAGGFWLGALAGGVIGHNSGWLGHQAWRGAALGAGAGWLLGAIADSRAATTAGLPRVDPSPGNSEGQPPAETIIPREVKPRNHAPSTPMSAANALFGR